ncbi:hypothetical protein ACOME3_010596 [Neoechinorhynchus agilis]
MSWLIQRAEDLLNKADEQAKAKLRSAASFFDEPTSVIIGSPSTDKTFDAATFHERLDSLNTRVRTLTNQLEKSAMSENRYRQMIERLEDELIDKDAKIARLSKQSFAQFQTIPDSLISGCTVEISEKKSLDGELRRECDELRSSLDDLTKKSESFKKEAMSKLDAEKIRKFQKRSNV